MKQNRVIYSILFAVWIGTNYLGVWGNLTQDMADHLAYYTEEPLYLSTFQVWVFNIFSVLFDSIFVAIAVGIFAYHYRDFKPWRYIILGLFIRYLVVIIFLPFLLYRHSISEMLGKLFEVADSQTYILGAIHLASAIVASYVGMSFGREADYLDEKDEQCGYVAGCSKKLWALLTIAFNPVFRLATKLSIILVYNLSEKVTSSGYWDYSLSGLLSDEDEDTGITGIIISVGGLALTWIITASLLFAGIGAIADKESAYRRAKIIGIFVVIPVLVLGIPLIRNRRFLF